MESLPGAWGSQSTNYFIRYFFFRIIDFRILIFRDFKKFDKTMKEMENGEEEMENNSSSRNV